MPGFTRKISRYNKNPARRKVPGVGGETYRGTRVNFTAVFDGAALSADVTVTFSKPVIYGGILPGWTGGGAQTVTGVTQTSATVWVVQFSAAMGAGVPLTVPFEDPSFRDSSGGYLQPGTTDTI